MKLYDCCSSSKVPGISPITERVFVVCGSVPGAIHAAGGGIVYVVVEIVVESNRGESSYVVRMKV